MRKFLLIVILFVNGYIVSAQTSANKANADSVTNAFFPVLGFSSDVGFFGGGIYNRYEYEKSSKPFENYLSTEASASTIGHFDVEVLYDQPESFGTNVRSTVNAFFVRRADDNFFGIGNATDFSEQQFDNDFFFFESIYTGLNYQARKPLVSNLDAIAGFGIEYQIPYISQQNSSFSLRIPNGNGGGFVNFLKTGLIWDDRDNEFDPQRGGRAVIELRHAPPGVSTFSLTTLRIDLRKYVRILDFVTLAGRVEGRYAAGDVPYWELSTLGNEFSLRGFPLNRFQGDSKLAANFELRKWLFRLPWYSARIGGQLFTDVGRVFTGDDDAGDLFEGYHQTFGFGGALSLFNPDFILRADLGFSEDLARLYIGVGYIF